MNNYTEFLYAEPSFAEGVARIIDFGDTLTQYNRAVTPEQADQIALGMDWRAVGADLRHAINRVNREHKTRRTNVKK